MSYQFIHVESYARKAGKGKAGGRTIRDVLAEAKREIGHHHHITNPHPPEVLFGDLDDVEGLAVSWAEQSKDARGHRLREDGLALLAGVVSFPSAENLGVSEDEHLKRWDAFRMDALIFLKKKYGSDLKCVVEHTDEKHPHLHFYCVPKLGARFESIHDGKAAALAAKSEKLLKGDQNQAYKEAMRVFQNDFFQKVGAKNGLARLGPKRMRLTRAEYQAKNAELEIFRLANENLKNLQAGASKKGYDKGYKEGLVASEVASFAEKLGATAKKVATGWKKKTKKELETEAQAREMVKKVQAAAKRQIAIAKNERDEMVKSRNLVAEREEKLEWKVKNFKDDLARAQQKIKDLEDQLGPTLPAKNLKNDFRL